MSSQKVALSRDTIARVALAIADKHGFEAVTMRRIAQELKVGTMSLYYYVKTKEDLVAAMDDALMGEVLLPSVPKDWRQALLQIAQQTHDVFIRHPWALIAMLSAPPGVNAMRHMEQCLGVLSQTRMTNRQKMTMLALIDDFVFGHALREAATRTSIDDELATTLLNSGNFPLLNEVFKERRFDPSKERFRKGLQALLASMADK